MSNTAVRVGVLPPNSSFTFSGTPPAPAAPVPGAPVNVTWERFPECSYRLTTRAVAVVDEWMRFDVPGTFTVVRNPPPPKDHDHRLSLHNADANRIQFKQAGLWILRHDLGGYGRDIECCVVPAEWLVALQTTDAFSQRRRWRSVCQDPGVTRDSAISALESKFLGSESFAKLLSVHVFSAQSYGS